MNSTIRPVSNAALLKLAEGLSKLGVSRITTERFTIEFFSPNQKARLSGEIPPVIVDPHPEPSKEELRARITDAVTEEERALFIEEARLAFPDLYEELVNEQGE